jgi:flagellar basal-body rod protein FlgB
VLDPTMRTIQASLDGLAARQRLIAENIANAEVPGYLASRVDFESSLREAVANGDFSDVSMTTTNSLAPTGINGNNVNLDEESVSNIETGLRFQMMTEAMNAKFHILKTSMRRDS